MAFSLVTSFWSTFQTTHFIHAPPSWTGLHNSSKASSQGITSPQLFDISSGSPKKRELLSKSASSCSTSIWGHLLSHIILGQSHLAQKSNRNQSLFVSQRWLLNSANAWWPFAVAGPLEWNKLLVSLRQCLSCAIYLNIKTKLKISFFKYIYR